MLLCLRISVLLGHAEVDHVNNIGGFGVGSSDQEVVGFNVAVDQILLVYRLDAGELFLLAIAMTWVSFIPSVSQP